METYHKIQSMFKRDIEKSKCCNKELKVSSKARNRWFCEECGYVINSSKYISMKLKEIPYLIYANITGFWHLNIARKPQYWSDALQEDCPLIWCSHCGKGQFKKTK